MLRYRICPKTTLQVGQTVSNRASIYFDFNEPIITNTTHTTVILPSATSLTKEEAKVYAKWYPNPSHHSATFEVTGLPVANYTLRIIDIYGRIQQSHTINGSTVVPINCQDLAAGVYFYQLQQDSGELLLSDRLIIQR